MEATMEPLEGNKVKLSVRLDEVELDEAIEGAFRKISREVRIPGFRPGKAPRRVLEARIGVDAARQQAIQDSLPEYYARAVREHEVDVIASPEIDLTEGADAGPLAFDAVVEVRPRIVVPGYAGIRVTIPSPLATDEEVDAQIERLRAQHGELEPVSRPAVDEDYVTIDLVTTREGEPMAGLSADDYMYQVGAGAIVAELDEQLRGAGAGAILQFEAVHPADEESIPLEFRVLVKEVQARKLPPLDDSFAAVASEMETLEELRADLAARIERAKRAQAQMELREAIGRSLADLVDDDVPEALVSSELQQRINDLGMRLQAQGLTIETWLEVTGRSADDLISELREAAERSARVDLALRAVAEAEGIEVEDSELDEELEVVARRLEVPIEQVRERFESADQMQAVRSDLTKGKALEWLTRNVEVVDEQGEPVDVESLSLDDAADDQVAVGAADAAPDTDQAEAAEDS